MNDPISDSNEDDIPLNFNEKELRTLLFDSTRREKKIKRLLNEQLIINDKLKLELEIEKRKTCIKVESSDASEKSFSEQQKRDSHEDLKDTFGTNSTILMQYKYNDLRECYIKCVKKLNKKNKQLKKIIQDAEYQRFLNIQLKYEIVRLHEKIEKICQRYFVLMDRRSEERSLYQIEIEKVQSKLAEISPLNQ